MMPEWSALGRAADFERLTRERWDVLVIGGGITGAGIALDAASRGLKTALVEKADFSSGTSSKSSKLIHGGLRYLAEMQFQTTLESSREKELLRKLAPHLIEEVPFLFPIRRRAMKAAVGAGLFLYDLAAGLPRGRLHRWLRPSELSRYIPLLPAGRFEGAFLYYDARADDCRLVLHVLKCAVTFGVLALNYVAVDGFEHQQARISAASIRDALTGQRGKVAASAYVNATGVWCDDVRQREDARAEPLVRPSKGIHLVVPRRRIRNDCALVLPSREDRRVVFLIPWGERTIVGTTDTDYQGDLERPRAQAEDIEYLLGIVNRHLPEARLGREDIVSTYAGLRPLLLTAESEQPSRVPRDYRVAVSPSGLLSVTGGKLTTYRRMAEKVVDEILKILGLPVRRSKTRRIPLFAPGRPDLDRGAGGADFRGDPSTEFTLSEAPTAGRDRVEGLRAGGLVQAYGSEAEVVRRMAAEDPDLGRPLVEGMPNILAEAFYTVRYERAVRLADILARRIRVALFAPRESRREAERLARLLAPVTGWNPARELDHYEEELSLHAPG